MPLIVISFICKLGLPIKPPEGKNFKSFPTDSIFLQKLKISVAIVTSFTGKSKHPFFIHNPFAPTLISPVIGFAPEVLLYQLHKNLHRYFLKYFQNCGSSKVPDKSWKLQLME